MKGLLLFLVLSLVGAVTIVFLGPSLRRARDASSSQSQEGLQKDARAEHDVRPKLDEAIHASAEFLMRANLEDGQFVYRVSLDPNHPPKPKYNVLRHAGTIYSLSSYYEWYPNDRTLTVLQRSLSFLRREMSPIAGRDDLLALWSRPELTGGDGPVQAKLGGAGLALVAMVSVERIRPGTTPMEDLRRLGQFILFMQEPNGAFYSKYIPDQGGRYDKWVSLYYPGEAALGLLMLYEIDPDPEWLQAAAKGIAYLARLRAGNSNVEADHWALLASRKLLNLNDHLPPGSISRHEIVAHAKQICQSILSAKPDWPTDCVEFGGFSKDGRTCPTATRLEGLLATLSFLPADENGMREQIDSTVTGGISFLLRAQVGSGEHAGAMPRAIRRLPDGNPLGSADFNRRAREVRIDYVQHALSAMIDYHELIAASDEKN